MGEDGPQHGGGEIVNEFAIYLACAAGILLPTIPGLLQLRMEPDDAIRVDERYIRDPRYLGKTFREAAAPILETSQIGTRFPFLNRRDEYARIEGDVVLPDQSKVDDVLLARGSVRVGDHTSLLDVYAVGRLDLGSDCLVRCIAAGGDVTLGERTTITRSIDVDGSLTIGRGCDLGASASATGTITVHSGSQFRRMYASRILFAGSADTIPETRSSEERSASMIVVGPGERYEGDLRAPDDVEIGQGAVVTGSITAGGNVFVAADGTVHGNLIARGDASLGQGSHVLGHVFSNSNVVIASAATIGSVESPKTVESAESLLIAPGATIHGWVICERGGTAVVIGA